MRWSLRRLEVVRHLTQTMSVTETARILNVSQPAVSQALREVEDISGVKLFTRNGNRLRVTPEATTITPYIDRVLEELARLDARASELRGNALGSIAVVAMAPLASGVVCETMAAFTPSHAGVQLSVETYSSSEIIRRIRQERADIGLTLETSHDYGVRTEPLMRAEMIALVASGHRLAEKAHLNVQDLAGEVVAAHSAQTPLGTMLRNEVGALEDHFRSVISVNQASSAMELARGGDIVALTHPFAAHVFDNPSVRVLPFHPAIRLTVTMVLAESRPESRLLSSFIAALREHAAKNQALLQAKSVGSM